MADSLCEVAPRSGTVLAAVELEVRLLVLLYQAAKGCVSFFFCFLLWASVVQMSTGRRPRAFAPDGHRSAIAERQMKAAIVVEGDPFADADPGLAAVGIALDLR
jgi:hypothetical protein